VTDTDSPTAHQLALRRPGIDTYQEPVLYLRRESPVCRSEGFEAQARVRVEIDHRSIIATLNIVNGDLLAPEEAALSEAAWRLLGASEGDTARISHPDPVLSFAHVRAKMHGTRFDAAKLSEVLRDAVSGRYSDVQISAFLTACATGGLDGEETVALTQAMIAAGERVEWGRRPIVDKHCVGGLPGNRTTPIVVPILAAHGLTIPKTSSRAITSPAGTADVMEVLTPVDLDVAGLRRVVEQEGGCIAWGAAVRLSPADDLFIRVERHLDIDAAGQLVASVLSKKAAAGSTHVLVDIPVGPTAKIRTAEEAKALRRQLESVGRSVGLTVRGLITDGRQPVGRGIGPALEARDVLAVLRRETHAPLDLRERALDLAGAAIELVEDGPSGRGRVIAEGLLDDGSAWSKLLAICEAQGGFREPEESQHRRDVHAPRTGRVAEIDCRRLARVAKLAGAPADATAGLELLVRLGDAVVAGAPILRVHADSPGELQYAMHYLDSQTDIIRIA
jgi:thymidine phosphorylase